ncbi:hypothetical protein CesoFtcFv8_026535 [Champsocephalus esox]|uniref:Uncharacterized protein n=1 Tax=Champsocephalus esox TaxID=159716 RepID=A0AAN8G3U7_9TELE|nr:hypothetical protein CesoFtcFv8_026535 [Champsocephalus esox]
MIAIHKTDEDEEEEEEEEEGEEEEEEEEEESNRWEYEMETQRERRRRSLIFKICAGSSSCSQASGESSSRASLQLEDSYPRLLWCYPTLLI